MARAEKKSRREGRTILFVDESGFYLLPGVVSTFAPRGQTPILRELCTRDHLSAISAISADGKLYFRVQQQAFNAVGVVAFLAHLLRVVPGKLLVIWDGSPIHRARVVKEFLSAGATKRLLLERLPGYAPDLNPDEGIWSYLKNVELRNLCAHDLVHLHDELLRATRRLRSKPRIVRACFNGARLSVG
jgi:transposase